MKRKTTEEQQAIIEDTIANYLDVIKKSRCRARELRRDGQARLADMMDIFADFLAEELIELKDQLGTTECGEGVCDDDN